MSANQVGACKGVEVSSNRHHRLTTVEGGRDVWEAGPFRVGNEIMP